MSVQGTWTRQAARRMTRRRILGATAVGGTAAFLAACGGDSASNNGDAAQTSSGTATTGGNGTVGGGGVNLDARSKSVSGRESVEELRERFHGRNLKQLPGQKNGPKYGGTLRISYNVPTTWDLAGPAASSLASYAAFHNKLVDFEMGDLSENPNLLKLTPDLAQAWEQPDSQTMTFKLTPGIKWQNLPPVNGREFTSEDVKYVAEVYKNSPVQSVIFRDVASVDTPDANTVVFKFNRPAAYFMNTIAQPMVLFFSREQHQSPQGLASGPVGTGAFIYESGQDRVGWKARKNPEYFKKDPFTGNQLPYVDRIETQYFADTNASLAAFRDKQIDVYSPTTIKHLWMDVLKTNPEVITQITTPAPSAQPYFGLRVDKPPFNDERVRRALTLAINREDILYGPFDGLAGYGYTQDPSFFGQEWPWTEEQMGESAKFDVAEAKKLLQAAGFSNGLGRRIEVFHYHPSLAIAADVTTLVADMWKKNLGIDVVETVPPDLATWQQKFFNVQYDDVIMAWFAGPSFDPDAYAFDALNSKSPKNYFRVNDPDLDRLTEAQQTELDVPKRQGLIRDIMRRDLDKAYRIFTLNGYKIQVRHPYVYNATDQVHAWGPYGWGSKVVEMIWLDK